MEEKDAFAKRMRRAVALAQKALPAIRAAGAGRIGAEALAEAMGISRATFFRHFATKDEALLYAVMGEAAQFTLSLADEGADLRGLPLWPVMRRAMAAFDRKAELPDFRARVRLVLEMPEIALSLRLSRLPQQERLVAELVARGVEEDVARIFVSASVAATDRCLITWARADEGDLSEALDRAFARLAQGH